MVTLARFVIKTVKAVITVMVSQIIVTEIVKMVGETQ